MGKLSYGMPNKHVLASNGADSDLMKFYSTTNATTYGRKWAKFQPRTGKHTGTGYLSNFRPGVYYSGRLDDVDNPTMGRIVADNYASVTQKSFQPSRGPTGSEVFPNSCKQVGSGFVRQKPLTIPTLDEVRTVNIDTRVASAPADIMPRAKPHLHKIQPKDPVSAENAGYGPGYMSTETQQRFRGHQPDRSMVGGSKAASKEDTGFTHAGTAEPITFHPHHAFNGDVPGWLTDRPTGVSIMKTHFRPSRLPVGNETLPKLATRSDRDTGFTSGTKAQPVFLNRVMSDAYDKAGDVPLAKLDRTKKQDPAEYINMTNPDNHSSIAANVFRGKPAEPHFGKTSVGTKEPSGYIENNDHYIQSNDNPARFITHYQTRFLDRTPKDIDREGHTWGGVQPQKGDGFTRSTQVHCNGPETNSTGTLRGMEPYVARSVKARDAFFDDHTYDTKLHSTLQRSVTMPCY